MNTKCTAALLAALALSCSVAAEPQDINDGIGVSVDMNGARLMHRSAIMYPNEAIAKNVQGSVMAEVRLDGSGNVVDAHVVSGPDELRKAVIQSVLNWHFTSDSANGSRQVTVTFTMPKGAPEPVRTAAARRFPEQSFRIVSISGPADLLARLPIHEGDMMTPELRASLEKTVHDYDEHFAIGSMNNQDGLHVTINPPNMRMAMPASALQTSQVAPTPGTLRLGANVAAANIVSQTPPEYPPLAKAARVQGIVRFEATIGKDGSVQNLSVIDGPPLLVQAAMQAVRQWVYKPTLLNGQPVQTITTIDINFSLPETN